MLYSIAIHKDIIIESSLSSKNQKYDVCGDCSFSLHGRVCNFIWWNKQLPGLNYQKYIKAFGCAQAKGYFLYEWMDSLDKLAGKQLTPREALDSSFRNSRLDDEVYEVFRTTRA